jgi:hypothetical protein
MVNIENEMTIACSFAVQLPNPVCPCTFAVSYYDQLSKSHTIPLQMAQKEPRQSMVREYNSYPQHIAQRYTAVT